MEILEKSKINTCHALRFEDALGYADVLRSNAYAAIRLLGLKSASFILCLVSFGVSAGITYLIKAFITASAIPNALLCTVVAGVADAVIFGTTVVKGAMISVLSGLLLAVERGV